MDASPTRSKTLQKMVAAAGAGDVVTVLPGQDFLALDPVADPRFENVTGLLLDPSCSDAGSSPLLLSSPAKAQLIEERVVVVERLGIEKEMLREQGLSAQYSQKD